MGVSGNLDIATSVVGDCLGNIALGARPLVIDEETGALAAALGRQGVQPGIWMRRATATTAGRIWPDAGPYSSALLRLPKAKDALDFALHAAAVVVSEGAPIVLFGTNEEGARSVSGRLAAVVDEVATVATKRHCRVMQGPRKAAITGHKSSVAAWRTEREISILGQRRSWISYPGAFARGGLDEGTALLLAHLPKLGAGDRGNGARVLDFAAGTGVIAAAMLQTTPGITADLVEIDALALAAAMENVPAARAFPGASLQAVGGAKYDAILSNPPVHDGIEDDLTVLLALIAEAPRQLVRGGELRIVVQRRIVAAPMMEKVFGTVVREAVTGGFQVLSAKRP